MLFWFVTLLILAVASVIFINGFFGALIASWVWPWQSILVGAAFYLIGRWWENAKSKFDKMRNFVLIYASALILIGFVVALYFGAKGFQPLIDDLTALRIELPQAALSAFALALFLWGAIELGIRALRRAREDVSIFGLRESLRRWLFER